MTAADVIRITPGLLCGIPGVRYWKPHLLRNRACAEHVIRLADELGIIPKTLIDVGANRSGWSAWLARKWRNMTIESFEPDETLKPIGRVHRAALSNYDGQGRFLLNPLNREQNQLSSDGIPVRVSRFDSLSIGVELPAILKVDCEGGTATALEGFGNRISEFSIVVCEMQCDTEDGLSQSHIKSGEGGGCGIPAAVWEMMLSNGFRKHRIVDTFSGWTWRSGWRCFFYDAAFWK